MSLRLEPPIAASLAGAPSLAQAQAFVPGHLEHLRRDGDGDGWHWAQLEAHHPGGLVVSPYSMFYQNWLVAWNIFHFPIYWE